MMIFICILLALIALVLLPEFLGIVFVATVWLLVAIFTIAILGAVLLIPTSIIYGLYLLMQYAIG
jgi:hypothetical protein